MKEEIKKGLACDSVHKPESILGRAVCLSVHPGKMILFPFVKWFDKRYRGQSAFAHLLFGFDLLLIGSLVGIASTLAFLSLKTPTTFEDNITLVATVAPREIKTGASSTLVIQYTNDTDEELRNAELSLTYPDYFLLQEQDSLDLGTIPVGGTGSFHVKGVMFGDVNGEQTFTTTMSFLHGIDRDIPAKKTTSHSFSPSSSTLELTLTLPEKLIAYQPIEGTIAYLNTGEIDFPMITIEPAWPEGFTLLSSSTPLIGGAFEAPAIAAGEQGAVTFSGTLGNTSDEVMFIFQPSFTFNDDRYRQETLTHTAPVVPPQLKIEHGVASANVAPGAETIFTIRYENIGENDLTNVVLGIESASPFFSKKVYEVTGATATELTTVAPGSSGEIQIPVRLRSYILESETTIYENLDLVTRSTASYTIGDDTGQRIASYGTSLASPMTTSVMLESFGRYATASGDQLGRGSLPPKVGEKTSYWVFWHVSDTFNDLTNVVIEGTLADNVTFTGRQSSSQNNGVEYDSATGTISWETDDLKPTLSPMSKVVGLAFELALTADASMVGTSPVLLTDIYLTAIDGRTGSFVSASGSTVTTDLPDDLMAVEKALVVE